MESVQQIITVSLWIITLEKIEISGYYKIFTNIKRIKFQLLSYRFEEDQYKIFMPGGIYQ